MSPQVEGWRLVLRREPSTEVRVVHVEVEDVSGEGRGFGWFAAAVELDGQRYLLDYHSDPTGAGDGFEAVQGLVAKLASGRWRVLEIVRPGELTRAEEVAYLRAEVGEVNRG